MKQFIRFLTGIGLLVMMLFGAALLTAFLFCLYVWSLVVWMFIGEQAREDLLAEYDIYCNDNFYDQ